MRDSGESVSASSNRLIVQTQQISDIDHLRQPVRGADIEVSQIEAGTLTGSVTYGLLGGLSVSLGHFSQGLRSHGVMSQDRHVIGMLINRNRPVTHWSYDVQPGDVIFDHLGGEHAGNYKGSAHFATISLCPADLTDAMRGEARLSDGGFWQRRTQIRPDASVAHFTRSRFTKIINILEREGGCLSPDGAEFWMRALVETFVCVISDGSPLDGHSGPIKSSLIVDQVDDFLRQQGPRPVHISQLCRALNVSRRTLHRAFSEVLGVGPVTYLRYHRLSGVRRVLTTRGSPLQPISQIALDFGFDDPGRFAGYYRRLFGERPSETVQRFAS